MINSKNTNSGSAPATDPGCLPAWGEAEIPAPPPYNIRNALRLIGPGAIALGMAIGSGEWLLGPSVTAKYGAALLWVATVSILLQLILNQEIIRYTLATGEPIFTGFLRTKPGPAFWGPVYTFLILLQLGWPGFALAGATAIVSAFKGSLTTEADQPAILMWGNLTFIACVLIIALGRKVEKTLERVEWFMIAWILIFLGVVGVFFTSLSTWGKVAGGFLGMGGNPIPDSGDWMLLASFAAYAGVGGISNGVLSNWVRDKGWGMAATTGYIPGLVGGKTIPLSGIGKVFPMTAENMGRFHEWMRFTRFEQSWIWAVGCFLGMGLPALMTLHYVPPGTDITGAGGWSAAAFQAQGIGRALGSAAWFLTLLNGFWILFSSQIAIVDTVARTLTDMLWSTHPRIRALARNDVRRVYYLVIISYALFGMWGIRQAQPGALIILGAFVSAFNFVVLGTHVIVVHRRFLPPELRMPKWREALLVVFVLMFATFTCLGIQSKWGDIRAYLGLG